VVAVFTLVWNVSSTVVRVWAGNDIVSPGTDLASKFLTSALYSFSCTFVSCRFKHSV
jgi:hypothetical protein